MTHCKLNWQDHRHIKLRHQFGQMNRRSNSAGDDNSADYTHEPHRHCQNKPTDIRGQQPLLMSCSLPACGLSQACHMVCAEQDAFIVYPFGKKAPRSCMIMLWVYPVSRHAHCHMHSARCSLPYGYYKRALRRPMVLLVLGVQHPGAGKQPT